MQCFHGNEFACGLQVRICLVIFWCEYIRCCKFSLVYTDVKVDNEKLELVITGIIRS